MGNVIILRIASRVAKKNFAGIPRGHHYSLRGICCFIAGIAAFLLAMPLNGNANTIQPILIAESGPLSGQYTYTYDVELTPNNYLQNTSAAPGGLPSSLTLLDFGTVSGTPLVLGGSGLVGADATTAGNWAVSTNLTGGSPLPNAVYAAGNFLIFGSNNSIAGAPDSASLTNVTLEYIGPGLATSSSQRSLIQLQIESTFVPGSGTSQSVSLDGNPFTNTQEPGTYAVSTIVPEPASLLICGIASVGWLVRRQR